MTLKDLNIEDSEYIEDIDPEGIHKHSCDGCCWQEQCLMVLDEEELENVKIWRI